ncbi:MAG TPA: serine/threonine-protein kinase [Pirellulaceae bacterium]|nr:serine/threonine-protein kinase [Pirellulaceae bacterium]
METSRCFTRDELRDYLLGNVLDDLTEGIAAHLETCARCEETVVALDQVDDTLVAQLKSPALRGQMDSPLPQSHDPTLEAAKQQLVKQIAEGLAMSDIEAVLDRVSPQRIGDYELIEPMARGGMGDVYRARHLRLEKMVALKILPQHRMRHGDAISRFAREMKIIGQMNHPAIVAAFDAGEETGIHYLTMEYIDGMDVSKLVRTLGPLDAENACEIVRQAAVGIEYAHQLGVVHRDIKPSNLMLDRQGQIKILDLGLATLNGTDGVTDELTTVGQLLGTLDYMAPEQCDESESIDRRCDVYGLGATLYKLLTGCAPYDREGLVSPLKKLRTIATSEPIPIQDRAPDIDSRLAAIVMKCLSRHPADRFGSARELAQALSPWANGQSLPVALARAQDLRSAVARELVAINPPVLGPNRNTRLLPSRAAERPALPSEKSLGPSSQRSGIRRWVWVACASLWFGLIAWAGIVIIIEYSGGRLVIESEVEGVQVVILQDAGPHSELRIEHGTASTRLWAGKYQVQIEGGSDQLAISNDTFELRRGETVIARITRTESPKQLAGTPELATPSPAPTYSGKTLEELTTEWISGSSKQMSPGIRVLVSAMTPEQRQTWIEQTIKTSEQEMEFNTNLRFVQYLTRLPVTWSELRIVLDSYYESFLEPAHQDNNSRITAHFDWRMFYPTYRDELLDYLEAQMSLGMSPEKHPSRAAAAIVALTELAKLDGQDFPLPPQLVKKSIAAGNYLLQPQVAARIHQNDQAKYETCLVNLLRPRLTDDAQVPQLFRTLLRHSSNIDVRHSSLVTLLTLVPPPDDGADMVLEFVERGSGHVMISSLLEQIADHPQFVPRIRAALRDRTWGMQPVKGLSFDQMQLGGGGRGLSGIMSDNSSGAMVSAMGGGGVGSGLLLNATGRSGLIAALVNIKDKASPFVGDLQHQLEWLTDPTQRTVTYRAVAILTGQKVPPLYQGFELQHYLDALNSQDLDTVIAGLQAIKAFFESRNPDQDLLNVAVIRVVERATAFNFLDPQVVKSPIGRAFLGVFESPGRGRREETLKARTILEEQLTQVPSESAPFVFSVFYNANLSNSQSLYRFASNFFESESDLLRRRAWALALESGSQLDKNRQDQLLSGPSTPELKMAFLLDRRAHGTTIAVSDDWTDAELATLLSTFDRPRPISVAIDSMFEQLVKRAPRVLEKVEPITLDLWNGPDGSTPKPPGSKTLLEFYLVFLERLDSSATIQTTTLKHHVNPLIDNLTQIRVQLDPPLQRRVDSWLSQFK